MVASAIYQWREATLGSHWDLLEQDCVVEAVPTMLAWPSSRCYLHLLEVRWVSEPEFPEQSSSCSDHILQASARVLLVSQVSVMVVLVSAQPGEALR
jgi:hypothetical protein